MQNQLGALFCSAALLVASSASAEENLSFVQTATSGTTISGYVDVSVEWPVGATGSRFNRRERSRPTSHNRGGHIPYSSAWNGAEGSVDNSAGSIIGSTEGVTIFPGIDSEANDTGGSDGIPVFDPANINLVYDGLFEGTGVMITSGPPPSFTGDTSTILPSEPSLPAGTLDVQTIPEPSPLALGVLACALFVVSQSRKRGFRSY